MRYAFLWPLFAWQPLATGNLQLATGTPKPLAAATAHLMLHGGSKEAAIGVFIHKNRLSAWQNVQ